MFRLRSKRKLKAEILELQNRLRQLEDRAPKDRAPRQPLHSESEMVGDFDVIEADGINVSKTGICFELKNPLFFDMRFMENNNVRVEKHARLIWVKQTENGRTRLGFCFESPDTAEQTTETDILRINIIPK